MQPDNEIMIDYLDEQLNKEEADQMERALQKDIDLNRELQYLKLAIDTVRLDAIKHKVVSGRQLHVKRSTVEPAAPAILRTMYKTGLRVAAVIVFFLCIATIYR